MFLRWAKWDIFHLAMIYSPCPHHSNMLLLGANRPAGVVFFGWMLALLPTLVATAYCLKVVPAVEGAFLEMEDTK